jgi:WD40 repeat protein
MKTNSETDMNHPPSKEETIFEAARLLGDVQEEAAYLERACGQDQELRRRLEKLLRAGRKAKDFFQKHNPAAALRGNRDVAAEVVGESAGSVIGRYKLLQKIGEGGMGVVYMAEQEEPVRRRVALKIIKLGMDTQQVVARFEAERQALALMDHPNIAKVLDGGATDTGRPYFVMELVQGVPITEFCDKNRLGAAERIKLFIQVCQAIQSAHQKGIIHRDLKPTNILVTLNAGVPVPMVIDFGVAKATQQKLTEKTVFTNYATMIGTPAYMSPEQAEMSRLDVDTRSDIYGLGVLLYELLTGTTPFPEKRLRSASYQEMQRIIMVEEPERPSTRLRQKSSQASPFLLDTSHYQLSTDLDWIVMKCLEKDRARRYETANGLAADLKRHLDDEPVVARPPSAAYKLQKAWRRNKLVFSAAVAVVLALVVGLSLAAIGWHQARVERDRALQARAGEEEQRKAAEASAVTAQEQRQRADHQLYVADMNLAQQAWEQNNIGQLRQLLKRTQDSPYRGFEWYFWQRLTHLALKTLRGHLSGVWSVAFSPDGQRIVTGSGDHTAKVWDAASSKELFALNGHSRGIRSVAYSPDGQRIVTGSDDKTAKVWEAASGSNLLTLTGHSNAIYSVAFSPDGRRIVTGSQDQTAKVWEAANGSNLLTLMGHSNAIYSVAFSPDGHRIVTGSQDHTARVWDAASGQPLLTLKGDIESIWSVAFSPDGQRIVTGSRDETARVWDAASANELFTLKGHSGQVWSVAFSPDGQQIVTGSYDETAKVWDAASGLPADKTGGNRLTLTGHSGAVNSVAFSPDGQRIVTGSDDETAKVWEAASGRDLLTLKGHTDWIASVAFSPDGQRIVTGSGDQTAKVWPVAGGKELLTLEGHKACVAAVTFSPDGQLISTGSWDSNAKVWNATSGKELLTLKGHSAGIKSVAFSPDGQRIVTGSADSTAKVWEAASGRELLTLQGHSDGIYGVAFSPDGRWIVTGGFDQTAKVWEAATGNYLFTLEGHKACVFAVTFSPDGRRIVTASWDATAKVWEAASGAELLTLKGHRDSICGLAFSPDGRRIATGSFVGDPTAKVWEAATAKQVAAWQEEERAQPAKAGESTRLHKSVTN